MKSSILLSSVVSLIAWTFPVLGADIPIRKSPPLKSESPYLGTKKYQPFDDEERFLKQITEKGVQLWPLVDIPTPQGISEEEWKKIREKEAEEHAEDIPIDEYELKKQVGEYVGWCGIVRKRYVDQFGNTHLLLEHKYFDGLTDLHLHIVSLYGAGDFEVVIPGKLKEDEIKPLSLIRVYGKVNEGNHGRPEVKAEYVRVWDWGRFTFMDYGKDKSNPEWVKLRNVDGELVYSPSPNQEYYETLIGKR